MASGLIGLFSLHARGVTEVGYGGCLGVVLFSLLPHQAKSRATPKPCKAVVSTWNCGPPQFPLDKNSAERRDWRACADFSPLSWCLNRMYGAACGVVGIAL